mgnify:CR=1 FL=1
MKIILGTPRSGTSFVANWYANELPDHKYMLPEKLGEYFHPDFFASDDVDAETLERISGLPIKCIFKLHTGKEMSKHIWEYISDKPVILVKRKDILGQFISIGVGYTTNKWVNFAVAPRWNSYPTQCVDESLRRGIGVAKWVHCHSKYARCANGSD